MRKMEGKIKSGELWQQWAALPLPPPSLCLSLSLLHFRLFPLLSSPAQPLPASLALLHRAAVNERVSWVWLHCSVEKGRAALSGRCAEGWCTRRNAFTRCVTVHSLAFSVRKGTSRCVWCRTDRFPDRYPSCCWSCHERCVMASVCSLMPFLVIYCLVFVLLSVPSKNVMCIFMTFTVFALFYNLIFCQEWHIKALRTFPRLLISLTITTWFSQQ